MNSKEAGREGTAKRDTDKCSFHLPRVCDDSSIPSESRPQVDQTESAGMHASEAAYHSNFFCKFVCTWFSCCMHIIGSSDLETTRANLEA